MSTWHTPPACQGQIVEVSYRWVEGAVERRTFDHSDRTEVVRRLESAWDEATTPSRLDQLESWDPWNDEPPMWLDRALDAAPVVSQ